MSHVTTPDAGAGAGPPLPDLQPDSDATGGLHWLGFWAGPLAFALLLTVGNSTLTPDQQKVAAVTAWTAIWWITAAVPIGITSLLPAALLPLVGVMGAREVAPLYMHDLVFLFIGAFVIALGLERWNVHKRIACWIIGRVGTSPRRLVLGFMIAAAFLSMWMNNTSTTLMLLPIGMAVIASVQRESKLETPFAVALLLGIAYSASVGGTASLIGTAPNQVFAAQLTELFPHPDTPTIDFGKWIVAFIPLTLLFIPCAWFLLTRVILRVPKSSSHGTESIEAERRALGQPGRGELLMTGMFVLTAILWITRAGFELGPVSIPGWVTFVVPDSVASPKTFVTDATVAAVMAILCFCIPVDVKRGVFLMDWKTAVKMPWEVLLLLGAGFVIAGSFKSTGLDRLLGESLRPLIEGQPDWIVVTCVVVFMAALTEITSNTATTIVLLPVLGQAAVAAEVSPLVTMIPATLAASCAFMLPVATPPNAVVFSSRLIPISRMARVGVWINLLMVVLIPLVFQFWIRRVLHIDSGLADWAKP